MQKLPKVGVRKPRNRVIMFRLTDAEYEAVLIASGDGRSLSDWVRTLVLSSAKTQSGQGGHNG